MSVNFATTNEDLKLYSPVTGTIVLPAGTGVVVLPKGMANWAVRDCYNRNKATRLGCRFSIIEVGHDLKKDWQVVVETRQLDLPEKTRPKPKKRERSRPKPPVA